MCVFVLQIQRRAVGLRSGSSWRGGGGAGAVLAAVRAALFRRAWSEGGAALKTLPRYAVRARILQVSTHKTLHGLGLTSCLSRCVNLCILTTDTHWTLRF